MKKAVVNVMIITIVAKLLGFAKEVMLSYFFGASGISDAYLISQTIPGIIFQFVGTGLATCFIPVYSSISNNEGEKGANYFTNTILMIVFIFSTVIVLLVMGNTEFVVKIFAAGFEGGTLKQAVFFTRIGIFSLYFSAIIYVMNSYLQMKNRFSLVAFTAVPNSIMILLSIIAGAKLEIIWLPIGSILAVFIQASFLLVMAHRENFHFSLNMDFKNHKVLEMLKLMIPVTIGVSINELNLLIDRTLASGIAVGGISALSYAESIVMFVQGIFVQTIATVYYPALTDMVEKRDVKGTEKALQDAMQGMFFLLIPVTIGCIVLSKDVVEILYGRGNFGQDAAQMTSIAFGLYTLGIVGYGFREIFSRFFYAYHDTKTPMINAAIGVGVNIIMNLTLSPIIGIGGLALATSVSSTLTAILLFIQMHKQYGNVFELETIVDYVKIIISAGIMGIVVYFVHTFMAISNLYISFVMTVLSGVITYFICVVILKVNVIKDIIKTIKKS